MQSFITKMSVKEKKIFYVAVFIVSLWLLDLLFLGPVSKKLANIESKIELEKTMIQNDLQVAQYEGKVLNEAAVFDSFASDQNLEVDQIYTNFFSSIESIAKRSNVDLVKSNPAETKTEDYYTKYYANIDSAGTMENIMKFLYTINTSDNLFKVVKFNLGPKRGSNDEFSISMTVSRMIIHPN